MEWPVLAETHIDRIPIAMALVHVQPRATKPQDMQHSVEEGPIVARWAGKAAPLRWQKRPDQSPFLVRQIASPIIVSRQKKH